MAGVLKTLLLSEYKENMDKDICPLPRKNRREEARVDGLVAKKLVQKHPHKNWLLEIKLKSNKKGLAKHQKAALRQVEDGKFLWKPTDMGNRQPGDYIYLGDADAIVCVVDGRNVVCEVNGGVITYKFKI